MFHLYDLPVHLVGMLFGDWLGMRSLLALDTASCSSASRNDFLQVVGSGEFCYRAPDSGSIRANGMKWCITRNARVNRVCLDGISGVDMAIIAAFLHITGASLTKVQISRYQEPVLLTAVLGLLSFSASHLKVLEIISWSEIDSLALGTLLFSCAHSLERLQLTRLGALPSSQLPNLQVLALSSCKADASALCRLVSACPRLRSFCCDNLRGSDACLDALADHCPLLQVLTYENGNPSDVSSLVRLLQACQDIEVVDISGTDDDNPSATVAHIAAIMQHCRKLKAFATEAETGLDAAGLAVAERVQDLRHLQLIGCAFSSDAPLIALKQHCHNLTSLYLSAAGSAGLPPNGLLELVKNLASVTELQLDETTVHDQVLMAIADSCPLLQNLALSLCKGYTEVGVVALAQGCTALRKMQIDPDDKLFPSVFRLLWQALRPGLQFSDSWGKRSVNFFWDDLRDIDREEVVIW
jgi:hypothetical protein